MPIFGERSEGFIRPFFKCGQPTSKVILSSILDQSYSESLKACKNDEQYSQELRKLNDELVSTYPANSVPSYFVQGTRTYLSKLYSREALQPVLVNGVRLKWERYQLNKNNSLEDKAGSLAIYYPGKINTEKIALIDKYKPGYIFSQSGWEEICKHVSIEQCADTSTQAKRIGFSKELVALLGITDDSILLITNTGKIIALP